MKPEIYDQWLINWNCAKEFFESVLKDNKTAHESSKLKEKWEQEFEKMLERGGM